MQDADRTVAASMSAAPFRAGNSGLWWLRRLFGDPIPQEALARFFDQTALMLASGLSIPEAITRAALTSDPEIQQMVAVASGPVAAGMPLHRALRPWQDRLPASGRRVQPRRSDRAADPL